MCSSTLDRNIQAVHYDTSLLQSRTIDVLTYLGLMEERGQRYSRDSPTLTPGSADLPYSPLTPLTPRLRRHWSRQLVVWNRFHLWELSGE